MNQIKTRIRETELHGSRCKLPSDERKNHLRRPCFQYMHQIDQICGVVAEKNTRRWSSRSKRSYQTERQDEGVDYTNGLGMNNGGERWRLKAFLGISRRMRGCLYFYKRKDEEHRSSVLPDAPILQLPTPKMITTTTVKWRKLQDVPFTFFIRVLCTLNFQSRHIHFLTATHEY